MKRERIREIAEIAILVGVAYALDLIFGLFSPFANGGSISPAMLPIFIIAYRRGLKNGLFAGLAFGVLQFLFPGMQYLADPLIDTIWKELGMVFLDYILPFTALGLAAVFKEPLKKLPSFVGGILFASLIRYIFHALSGVIIWGPYAEMAGINPWFYSFVAYNLPYMAASAGLCLLIGVILFNRNVWDYNLAVK